MTFTARKIIVWIPIAAMMLGLPLFSLANTVPYALGVDAIAGQDVLLKAVNFPPEKEVVFNVKTPDGTVIRQMGMADSAGDIDTYLDGYHARTAGEYSLIAETYGGKITTGRTNFTVLPGETSASNSWLKSDREILNRNYERSATFSLRMADRYGNALPGQAVKIISSRTTDQIDPAMTITDESGMAEFTFTPRENGLATIIALDTAEDKVIAERLTLSVVDGAMIAESGGDYLNKAYAATFGPLAAFEIEDIPATVARNANISFTVKAVDDAGEVVEDYTGTVRFSAEGENSSAVSLPDNYKFLATDLGVHTFSLGLSFAENGNYKVIVIDLSDKFKQGETTVIVGTTAGSDTGDAAGGEKPLINSPAAGTYSQSEQTVSGTAKAGSNVLIFDNEQQIGSVPVGPTGKFTFQTEALADGKHLLYVVSQDVISLETTGTSDTVEINIDVSPPKIDEIVIEPTTEIKPGSVIDVTLFSEENLAQAALIFNYDIVELNASTDDPSSYVGTIQAPADPGVYKVSVLLVDELQNEITYDDAATVTVSEEGGTVENTMTTQEEEPEDLPGEETTGQQVAGGAPSQVSGLIAYGVDGRVTLVWDAATDDTMVKAYRVYYGSSIQQMTNMVETKDASTTWYVPGLENGKEYFFAVTALDEQGNESESRSEIVSGIPFVLEINNALSGQQAVLPLEQPDLRSAAYSGPLPEKTTESGPGLLLLLGSSVLGGYFFSRKK